MGNIINGTNGADLLFAGNGGDTLNGLDGGDNLTGGNGDDVINAGAGNDFINVRGKGNDTVDGGDGIDRVTYYTTGKLTLNLEDGNADDSSGFIDHLVNIERISGTAGYGDVITGRADTNETLYGNGGNDTLDGGVGGSDTAGYQFAQGTGGVYVSLAGGFSSGADGNDVLNNFENLEGSNNNDTLTGDDGANILSGLNGDDILVGGGGNDTLYGNAGNDRAVFDGLRSDYTITTLDNGDVEVKDNRDGAPNGTDLVRGVKYLQFADTTLEAQPLEHVVSTTITGHQAFNFSIMLRGTGGQGANGYATVFRAADASGEGIYLRLFSGDGDPRTDDILVNTTTTGNQRAPTAAALADGTFVVMWDSSPETSFLTNDPLLEIKMQHFDADGNKMGDEVTVNTTTAFQQRFPSVTAIDNGGFFAVWQSRQEGGGTNNGIFGQQFNSDGSKAGGEIHINTTEAGGQLFPLVRQAGPDANSNGVPDRVVAVWQSLLSDGSTGFVQQQWNTDGTKAGAETVIYKAPPGAGISFTHHTMVDGGYVVTWTMTQADGSGAVMGRVFNTDGTARSPAVTIAAGEYYYGVDALAVNNGNLMVVWDVHHADGSSAIVGQNFDLVEGGRVGEQFVVSDHSNGGGLMYPTLSPSGGGDVLVSWNTQGNIVAGDTGGVYQQLISGNGEWEFGSFNTGSWPAATEFTVRAVQGGAKPQLDASGHYVLSDPIDLMGTTQLSHLALSGTAAFGTTVTIYSSSHPLVTVGVDDQGLWFADLKDLPAGTHYLSAVVTDVHGNTSVPSEAFQLTVDNAVIDGTADGDDQDYWFEHGADSNAQWLNGGAGDDTLNGGGGYDTLDGGAGDDTYVINSVNTVTVLEAADGGIDTMVSTVGLSLQDNVENGTIESSASTFLVGNELDNVLTSGDGGDFISGGAGNDTLVGNGGGNNLLGGAGNDVELGGDFGDYFIGGASETGDDLMDGGAANDYFNLSPGHDTIAGGEGDGDRLYTNLAGATHGVNINLSSGVIVDNGLGESGAISGVEEIEGTRFDDTLIGSAADEQLISNGGNDSIDGGAGSDIVFYGGSANFTGSLSTGSGSSSEGTISFSNVEGLGGGSGNDSLTGSAGNDSLGGFLGDDTMAGLGGNDELWALGGRDTAVYRGSKTDYIISTNADGSVKVQDKRTSGATLDGTDTLHGVRTLKFGDGSSLDLTAVDKVVSSTTSGYQVYQSTAAHWFLDGGYIQVFRASDGAGDGLYARVFDEDGNAQGGNILINASNTAGDQRAPVVASLVYGGYVVAYHSNPVEGAAFDDQNWDIKVQILGNDGLPVGGAISVATTYDVGQRLPSVTGLANGNFMVTWQSAQAGEDGHLAVYARLFASDGTPLGLESKVGTMSDDDQTVPVVTALPSGGAIITWAGVDDAGNFGYLSQRLLSDGSKSGAAYSVFTVDGPNATVSAIHTAKLAGGGHVLTWIYDADGAGAAADVVMARNYDSDGNGVGPAFVVSTAGQQRSSSVLGLSDGSYMVVWDAANADGSSAIMGRRYNSDNSPATAEFKISNSPAAGIKMFPTLAEFQPGQVVVAWGTQNMPELANSGAVYQQIIDFNGNPLFYAGDSSGAKPATPAFSVQTVVGGIKPVLDPAYPSLAYYVKDTPLSSGATTANNHVVVSGTAAAGSSVTIKVGASITRTVGVDDEGRWAVDLSELADGTYAISATVTNLFGASSAASSAFNLTVKYGITGTGGADGEGYWLDRKANGTAQSLFGGDGNDTLNGGGGSDTLNGGSGDDTYIVTNAGITIVEAPGGGTDTVKASVATTLAANVENGMAYDGTAVALTGNALNNVLSGNAGNDTLIGGAGNDTLAGNGGDDTYEIDAAGDVIIENPGAGIDTVKVALAAAGSYTLGANLEKAIVSGTLAVNLAGNELDNVLTGNAAANKLDGGLGNDTLDGGAGIDSLSGGAGDDVYVVDVLGDVITEVDGGGTDMVQTTLNAYTLTAANVENLKYIGGAAFTGTGSAGANNIEGGAFNDKLDGGAGNDTVVGGDGNDTLLGGEGKDVVAGGAGNDSLDGGAGADTLIGNAGNDTLEGGAITDKLGYSDANLVSYASATAGVNVNLATGVAQDGLGGTDKLSNLNFVVGSAYNDVLTGSTAALLEQFDPGRGDDTIDGGAIDALNQEGNNRVSYSRATGGVTVDLAEGTGDGAGIGHDTLLNINQVSGSLYDDELLGSDTTLTEQFEGRSGDDTIDGRGGIDLVRYDNAASAVYVNLDEGQASDGDGGFDTLLHIEGVRGSAFGDTLTGGNPDNGDSLFDGKIEIFMGNAGNDIIDGGAGYDRADYTTSTSAVTVNLATGLASDGFGGTDTLSNIEGVRGSAFNDTLLGSDDAPFESFEGREGNDSIDGKEGVDRADYERAKSGVVVNLTTGTTDTGKDGYGGTDKLLHIEDVRGSSFNDSITGSADDNYLQGLAGNDSLLGGAGFDRLDAGTGVDFVDGGADADTLVLKGQYKDYTITRPNDTDVMLVNASTGESITARNIEVFEFSDESKNESTVIVNTAGNGPDLLNGTPDNDQIDGLGGADTMLGYQGNDTYTVDVAGDVVSEAPGEGEDTVKVAFKAASTYTLGDNVENAIVTAAATVAINLAGNAENNRLTGNAAANKLTGGAGYDTLDGGAGNDTMSGGADADVYVVDASGDVVIEDIVEAYGHDRVETTLGAYTLGANVEDLSYTGELAFNGKGNAANNHIASGSGNDTLSGEAGNDIIEAGAGNDSISGGAGDDGILAGAGNDTVLGGAGADYIEGGTGNDSIDGGELVEKTSYLSGNAALYIHAGGAVNINLATGVAQDGDGGIDKLANINVAIGSDFNDTLTGSSALLAEFFDGGDGDNTIDGGLITNVELNSNAAMFGGSVSVVADLAEGTAQHGDFHDTLININHLIGSNSNDTLLGSDSEQVEIFDGDHGDNVIDGRGGFDWVRYDGAADFGVIVNLAEGTADNTYGNDTLSNIEGVVGSRWDDQITGGNGANGVEIGDGKMEVFIGGMGNDTLDGGVGYDRVDYRTSTRAVTVNLAAGTAKDGLDQINGTAGVDGTDTLLNMEGVRGSAFNDTLLGSDGAYETFDGREGNDSIDGKGGTDRVDYDGARAAVKVDLAAGTANDGYGGTDKLLNIEDVRGSALNDTITGSAGANHLEGLAGNDSLQGGAGEDVLDAGKGVDTVDGGADSDTLVLLGSYGSYTITRVSNSDLLLVNAGTGESITARNVETFAFADGERSYAGTIVNQITSFDDVLFGSAGPDTLNGLAGNDTMSGWKNDDTYVVDAPGDVIDEPVYGGIDRVEVAFTAAGTYTLSEYVEHAKVTAAATIAVNLVGNNENNELTGNAAANKLDGGAGNDFLIGGAGNDSMTGGAGNDRYDVDAAGDVVTELADMGTDLVFTTLASYTLGANVENLLFKGTGKFSGTGNALANYMAGGAGDDTLSGAAGADSLFGGEGNDSVLGGDGDDALSVGTGSNDVADGGAGNDTLTLAGDFDDYVRTRTSATDTRLVNSITGEAVTIRSIESVSFNGETRLIDDVNFNLPSVGNDNLEDSDGNDFLDGGLGNDTMAGLEGDDIYVVDVAADLVVEAEDAGKDTVQVAFKTAGGTYTMTANVEDASVTGTVATNVVGNGLDNTLTGNAVANKLEGGEGNDTLIGGAGSDTLIGGAGDDVYVVDVSTDVVTEGAGAGTDRVETALAAYTLAANVENLLYKGALAFNATGNALDNTITGGVGKDTLTGGLGSDSLSGGAGDDSLLGGDGNDTLVAGTGAADFADGGAGSDLVQVLGNFVAYTRSRVSATDTRLVNAATGETLTIRNVETVHFADGDRLIDEVNFNLVSAGNDTLVGGDGPDTLNGGAGVDSMSGGKGSDTYVVDVAGDTVVELDGEGTDQVNVAFTTAGGTYSLTDNVENASVTGTVATNLLGNGLNNVLTGNAVANKLEGGAGDDKLIGGLGTDTMIGGAGNDTFVVDVAADVVTEADGGGTDSIETALASYTLGNFLENLTYTGSLAFSGTGNALGNTITGGNGKDTLTGGLGNDSLLGGAGDDSLLGGAGNDTLAAGTGAADFIDGGDGDGDVVNVLGNFLAYTRSRVSATDTRLVNAATGEALTIRNVETVHFADGDRLLAEVNDNLATAGNDVLTGGDNADTINGGAGADSMSAGLGDDTYVVDVAGDVVTELADEGTDLVNVAYATAGLTFELGANIENASVTGTVATHLKGNGLDNVLTGNGVANKLEGGDGNDKLVGGAGNDTMIGGAGNDVYVVDVGTDVVTEADGGGTDRVETALATYSLATLANVENLSYTGALAFTGTGNAANNTIVGGIGKDTLSGGLGNDSLSGGAGDDSLLGGDGNDTLVAGAGAADIIDGGAGDDLVQVQGAFLSYTRTRVSLTETRLVNAATGEALTIRNVETVHFADGDRLLEEVNANLATTGNDTLTGSDGPDTINGGAGADSMSGGVGNDTYFVDAAGDSVSEEADAGVDLVNVAYTTAGLTYILADNVENATVTGTVITHLTGNGLDNVLTGNGVANKLDGGLGNDKLIGGAGNDTLSGGAGNDVYVVDATGDVVTEAVDAGTDRVETALGTYTLATVNNVENLSYTGSVAFTGTGNALANTITGGIGADKLSGGAGADTLIGGAGNDALTGGTEADSFVFNSLTGTDTISDFITGIDKISISQAILAIGDGDLVVESAETRGAAGGFSADAELVIFTANAGGTRADVAATAIGSASGNFTLGQQALFVVDNGSNSYVYLFKSSGTDALVSAGELTQIAILTGKPSTDLADYQFVA